jgi:hypothetical protein
MCSTPRAGTTSRPPKWIKPLLTRLIDERPTRARHQTADIEKETSVSYELVRRYAAARIDGQLDLGLAAECLGMPDDIVAAAKRLDALVAVGFDGCARRTFARSVGENWRLSDERLRLSVELVRIIGCRRQRRTLSRLHGNRRLPNVDGGLLHRPARRSLSSPCTKVGSRPHGGDRRVGAGAGVVRRLALAAPVTDMAATATIIPRFMMAPLAKLP